MGITLFPLSSKSSVYTQLGDPAGKCTAHVAVLNHIHISQANKKFCCEVLKFSWYSVQLRKNSNFKYLLSLSISTYFSIISINIDIFATNVKPFWQSIGREY